MTTENPNSWAAEAIRQVEGDGRHLTPTPLRPLSLSAIPDVEIYVKDESAHPTGSMKYRLVRAMFCEAIARGAIRADTPVIAATSGAVAIAAAHLMIPVPDAASIAALRWLRTAAGIEAGPATGTNFWGTCHLVARMREAGARGSIVTIIGDTADPYRNTHLDPAWMAARGLDPTPYEAEIERFARTGEWPAG
ncbi:pyridoxal-phosphate dependent enzyme [Streptomyces sp. NPDC001793]|uniref:pyridoxal-phosphate dependent enzyme n=1 Tax=Streptomyces sp. NPDC001793 TaxID=3154657 RepID=UPI00332D7505